MECVDCERNYLRKALDGPPLQLSLHERPCSSCALCVPLQVLYALLHSSLRFHHGTALL